MKREIREEEKKKSSIEEVALSKVTIGYVKVAAGNKIKWSGTCLINSRNKIQGKHPMGVLHSFSIRNIFYNKMDLKVRWCRFENLPIYSNSYKSNNLKTSHPWS